MHFTYQKPEGDLQQGDLLEISDNLCNVLKDIHPYYASHPDYSFLMVLTQSCDLVRHKGEACKSKYITVAAVRPLGTALKREVSKYQRSSVERNGNLCSDSNREYVEGFLAKLLNNNLDGYFFLEEDPDALIHDPHVAFLALSVALKAELHYRSCLAARVAQLSRLFQAKLGMLVGNLYSRVGTPAWVPKYASEEEFKDRIERTLDNLCYWVDAKAIYVVKNKQKQKRKVYGDEYSMPADEISTTLEEYVTKTEGKRGQLVSMIIEIIGDKLPEVSADSLEGLRKRLMSDTKLSRFL